MEFLTLALLLLAFLYFGYRDDFKRNPRIFIGTVIGVLGSFLIISYLESWKGIFLLIYNGLIFQFFFRNKEENEKREE